ncbi:MAG TPA: tetratricopeptide repeat protein [Bryobacteraceae bacterium]|nr:tetratricopeptide repeat protein [Bryobacteraceae bacterium]
MHCRAICVLLTSCVVSSSADDRRVSELLVEARSLTNAWRLTEAEGLLLKARSAAESEGTDPYRAAVLNNLGSVYESQGRLLEARDAYQLAVSLWERCEDEQGLAQALNNLAGLYCRLRRYRESERLHFRSLAIREKLAGPVHADVSRAWNNLTVLYLAWGRLEDAEEAGLKALQKAPEMAARPDLEAASIRVNLAIIGNRARRFENAEAHARHAVEICAAHGAAGRPCRSYALTTLARALAGQRRGIDALAAAEPAVEIARELFGEQSLSYADSLHAHATALVACGRKRDAEQSFKEVQRIRKDAERRNYLDVTIDISALEAPPRTGAPD